MQKKLNSDFKCTTFLNIYQEEIAPRLKKIDLCLKENENLSVNEASNCLEISKDEVLRIMEDEHIKSIDKKNFYIIMKNGSSIICRLFKRELDCGSPYTYSFENISYIYGLDVAIVEKTCKNLGINEITSYNMPKVFSKIILFYR